MTYQEYCQNMRRQGKTPKSQSEFERDFTDLKSKAESVQDKPCETSGEGVIGTIASIIGKFVNAMANHISKM